MTTAALLLFEASRIQSYLTAGGRLRDLAGGSALIEQIGDASDAGLLGKCAKQLGLEVVEPGADVPAGADNKLVLLRNSGGAVQAIAPSQEKAEELLEALSLLVLDHAPGLEVLGASVPLGEQGFEVAWRAAREELSEQKQSARAAISFSPPFLARCEATGEVAYKKDSKDRRLASNPWKPRDYADEANERLKELLKPGQNVFPLDVDDLSKDDGGYLAVIHMDGNDIGRLLRKEAEGSPGLNELLKGWRDKSKALADLAEQPIKAIIGSLDIREGQVVLGDRKQWEATLKSAGEGSYLPLRPLVMGGDDLTIVCEGAIALPLVLSLLQQFEEHSKSAAEKLGKTDGDGLTACAGVAIVKKHYPFAKAYELSEQLMKEAKKKARKAPGSYVDFEVVTATQHTAPDRARSQPGVGVTKDAEGLRLTRRPYSLTDFDRLLKDAWDIHARLPSRQVRAIADAACESKAAANSALKHLLSQLGRGLSGLRKPLSADDVRKLLNDWGCLGDSVFDDNATAWLDLIEVSRFFEKEHDQSEVVQEAAATAGGAQ